MFGIADSFPADRAKFTIDPLVSSIEFFFTYKRGMLTIDDDDIFRIIFNPRTVFCPVPTDLANVEWIL